MRENQPTFTKLAPEEQEWFNLLRKRVRYDPETGLLFKEFKKPQKHKELNRPVGSLCSKGYLHFMYLGQNFLVHRLAWFLTYGCFPEYVDHINGVPSDNRLCNLRLCSLSQNSQNTKLSTKNTSGVKGVTKRKFGYVATVRIKGTTLRKWFGFKRYAYNQEATFEAATSWVKEARVLLHKEFTNHG